LPDVRLETANLCLKANECTWILGWCASYTVNKDRDFGEYRIRNPFFVKILHMNIARVLALGPQ